MKYFVLFLATFNLSLSSCCATPVRAEGNDSFRSKYFNDEYYFSVIFPDKPSEGYVCTSLSGGHPHGFFALYGNVPRCGLKDMPQATAMSIYADFNVNDEQLSELFSEGCTNENLHKYLSREDIQRLSLKPMASEACAVEKLDGQIEIQVVTQGGGWPIIQGERSGEGAWINYSLFFRTNKARLQSDISLFERFLRSLKITSPK